MHWFLNYNVSPAHYIIVCRTYIVVCFACMYRVSRHPCFSWSTSSMHATHTLIMQSADAKKEEFRKYLEKSGVIDALTKALVGLYEEPERPQSAVEYVRKYLGSSSTANVDVDALRNENEEMRNRIRELSRTVDDLKKTNNSR